METDILDFALEVVLSQPNENKKWRPVYYYSRKLSPAELNYKIYNKELLVIIDAF